MFRMMRTRRSAPALLLVLVLFMGALPASAGTGPAAGLSLNWEDLWSRFVEWASVTFEETSPMIDPDGKPRLTGDPGTEPEPQTSPMIDPNG